MSESRADSLAAELKRLGIFDDYFAWWLQERPTYAERLEWLDHHNCSTSNGAIHRLHKSHEAAEWRNAEAAYARKALDERLPQDIPVLIRKSLLEQRFNATLAELTHGQLMDHLAVERAEAEIKLKEEQNQLRRQDLDIKERRIVILEREKEQAALELQKLRNPDTGNNEEARAAILDEVDRIMGLKK